MKKLLSLLCLLTAVACADGDGLAPGGVALEGDAATSDPTTVDGGLPMDPSATGALAQASLPVAAGRSVGDALTVRAQLAVGAAYAEGDRFRLRARVNP